LIALCDDKGSVEYARELEGGRKIYNVSLTPGVEFRDDSIGKAEKRGLLRDKQRRKCLK